MLYSWLKPHTSIQALSQELEESAEPFTAASPATKCEVSWTLLLTTSLNILREYESPKSDQDRQMIDIWERVIARGRYGVTYPDLSRHLKQHPDYHPSAVIEQVLYDVRGWSASYTALAKKEPIICQFPGPPSITGTNTNADVFAIDGMNITRGLNQSATMQRRLIDAKINGVDQFRLENFGHIPGFIQILTGILIGMLPNPRLAALLINSVIRPFIPPLCALVPLCWYRSRQTSRVRNSS